MSTAHKWDLAGATLIASATQSITDATTTAYDFGTPNDIDLRALADYKPGDRLLVVISATTAGTTSNLTHVIQDAPDNAGSIGTPAAAVTSVVAGALAATTGNDFSAFAVKVQPERPWLRISATLDDATDTLVCNCMVFAVPSNV
jgi:hypothetical protein